MSLYLYGFLSTWDTLSPRPSILLHFYLYFKWSFCLRYLYKKALDKCFFLVYNSFRYATMAQLVEHILGKDEVIGSIPISSSKKIKQPEWVAWFFIQADKEGLVCNQCALALHVIATCGVWHHAFACISLFSIFLRACPRLFWAPLKGRFRHKMAQSRNPLIS